MNSNTLANINFPPIQDTSSGDIICDFFNPALAASVRYDRGVGFFSASWLRFAAKGMRRAELLIKSANKIVELSRLIDASEHFVLEAA